MEEGISWSVEKETHKSWSRAVGNKIASFLYLGHLISLLGGKFSKEDYGIKKEKWAELILWDAQPTQINDVLYFFKRSYLIFN